MIASTPLILAQAELLYVFLVVALVIVGQVFARLKKMQEEAQRRQPLPKKPMQQRTVRPPQGGIPGRPIIREQADRPAAPRRPPPAPRRPPPARAAQRAVQQPMARQPGAAQPRVGQPKQEGRSAAEKMLEELERAMGRATRQPPAAPPQPKPAPAAPAPVRAPATPQRASIRDAEGSDVRVQLKTVVADAATQSAAATLAAHQSPSAIQHLRLRSGEQPTRFAMSDIRQAIIMSEILQPPLALRE